MPARKSAPPAQESAKTSPAKPTRELNDRQTLFVEHYVQTLNAKQSAIKAGYSEKTAEQQGYQLLQKPSVQAAISEISEKRSKAIGLTTERLLQEAMRLAFFDIRKLVDKDGNPLPLNQLDDDTAAAIQGLDVAAVGNADVGVGQVLKYKIADKNSAIERLFKHKGLFKADNEQNNPGDAMARFMAELSARGSRLPVKKSEQ
jgi:phage terminase small subunit